MVPIEQKDRTEEDRASKPGQIYPLDSTKRQKKYPKGVKVSDLQMADINLTRHSFHGDWNHTISPHRKNHRPKRID